MARKYRKGDVLQSQKGDTWKVLGTGTSPVTGKPTLQVGKVVGGKITSKISGVDESPFRKKR